MNIGHCVCPIKLSNVKIKRGCSGFVYSRAALIKLVGLGAALFEDAVLIRSAALIRGFTACKLICTFSLPTCIILSEFQNIF